MRNSERDILPNSIFFKLFGVDPEKVSDIPVGEWFKYKDEGLPATLRNLVEYLDRVYTFSMLTGEEVASILQFN